ncbi:MAG: M23 family metallopeptidase [Spirochaetota bacterium]
MYKFLLLSLLLFSCNSTPQKIYKKVDKVQFYTGLFAQHPEYIADGFDFPVGKPHGYGYLDAQPFQQNDHLGEDWIKKGRKEMGVPIYASANGIVSFADNHGSGWGNVITIVHRTPSGKFYETLYAHLQKVRVVEGDLVKKGQNIGTMGDADGIYWVHLHFELREDIYLPIGGGYSSNTTGYLDPKKFIKRNRKL